MRAVSKRHADRRAGGAPPLWLALVPLMLVAACGGGALEPRGTDAQRTFELTMILVVLGTAIFVFVLALLAASLLRHRRSEHHGPPQEAGATDDRAERRFVVGWGIAMPSGVLVVLVGLTLWVGADLGRERQNPLVVEVTGHQFWWDVRYPELDIRTANEIHLPVDRPVELRLESADVIHSFWIPQLAGKRDLIPGRTNMLTLESDTPGRYQGYCAEFCGIQHTNMRIEGVVHSVEDFEDWVDRHQQPAAVHTEGSLLAGQEAFLGSSCVYCHAVEGTNATSTRGPDLTHLMSRHSLGAGALPMTRGNLAGWILDPQHSKPGNHMPPTLLEPDQLQYMLEYLESLR